MADHHSSAQGLVYYWRNEYWFSAGGTAMNGAINVDMSLQSSFHIIHSAYRDEHNRSQSTGVVSLLPPINSIQFLLISVCRFLSIRKLLLIINLNHPV